MSWNIQKPGDYIAGPLTITGDLTVDTSTLKVDSTNNRVGVLTASPTHTLDVRGIIKSNGTYTAYVNPNFTGAAAIQTESAESLILAPSGQESLRCAPSGVYTFGDGAGGTRATLNSTGLGIGATPSYLLHVQKSQVGQTAVFVDNQQNNAAASSALLLSAYGGTWNVSVPHSATFVNPLIFKFGSTEMMRLDASGNLLLGKTVNNINTVGFQSTATGEVSAALAASTNAATQWTTYSTGAAAYRFYVGMGGTVFATNTTISAISDSRLKENVQDLDVGLNEVLALKPRKFDWKAGKGKDIKGDRGFIAQEFETVFPNLIDEWKDEAPEGETPYKSVRQDLIPVLVKAIQELTARVQTLEAK